MQQANTDFALSMKAQAHEITVHRWIESEKAGYDLGSEAELDWVRRFAKRFRDEWNAGMIDKTIYC